MNKRMRGVLGGVTVSALVAATMVLAAPATAETAVVKAYSPAVQSTVDKVKAENIRLEGKIGQTGAFDTAPARDAIIRLAGESVANQFTLNAVPRENDTQDWFGISGTAGAVVLTGTSPAELLTGFSWYLKYVGYSDIGWDAAQINLPTTIPAPAKPIVRHATSDVRLFGNDIWSDYTAANWTWEDWEHELDVLALSGYNEVFVTIGQEVAAHNTFRKYGFSEQEMLDWTPPQAHAAAGMWQGGWNVAAGGRTAEEERKSLELGQKIVERINELGMHPVFPGYVGFVPLGFTTKNPGASVVGRGEWMGEPMLDWLDPRTDLYAAVAADFYAEQEKLFGVANQYAMNPFTEGGTVAVPLPDAGLGVQKALAKAHPDALWQMHYWGGNPKQDLLAKLNPAKVIIVDFWGSRDGTVDRDAQWPGYHYTTGGVWNFGGHTTLGANGQIWSDRYWADLSKSSTGMAGTALSPEGGHGDAASLELFGELAWTEEPINVGDWFAAYGQRRVGGPDTNAAAAWRAIGETAYSMPAGSWDEAQDSLYNAKPSLSASKAAAWSPTSVRYDAAAFAKALPLLLKVDEKYRGSRTYQYDLVVVARQVLDNDSRALLGRISQAYNAKNVPAFDELTSLWLDNIKIQDQLTGTVEGFLLGKWVADAQNFATTPERKQKNVRDAKEVLTSWGTTRMYHDNGLADYCNRGWAGLLSGYYLPRWSTYFDSLRTAMNTGASPKAIDWFAVSRTFVEDDGATFATEASDADVHALATAAQANHDRNAPKVPTDDAYLSDLTPSSVNGAVVMDKRIGGFDGGKSESIILDGVNGVNGVTYAKGIGVNSPADVSFMLGGNCTEFTSVVGIDTSMNKSGANPTVKFIVTGDGKQLYASPSVVTKGTAAALAIDVTGVQTLTLKVDQVDNNWWDRADWADAKVTCGKPVIEPVKATIQAVQRCVAGKVTMSVSVSNGETTPISAEISTVLGAKTVASIAPGKTTSSTFTSKVKDMTNGQASAVVSTTRDGVVATSTVTADYAAITCG